MTLLPQASCRPGKTPETRDPVQLQKRVLETVGWPTEEQADRRTGSPRLEDRPDTALHTQTAEAAGRPSPTLTQPTAGHREKAEASSTLPWPPWETTPNLHSGASIRVTRPTCRPHPSAWQGEGQGEEPKPIQGYP